MKTLSVLGLAASCCLVSFLPAVSIAQNSNSVTTLTCRVALEGTEISEVQQSDLADPCCYVLEEADWYNRNGVLLHHFYQRQDDDHIYLTLECRDGVAVGDETGTGSNSATGSSSANPGGSSSSSSASSSMMPSSSSSSTVPSSSSSSIVPSSSSSSIEPSSSSSSDEPSSSSAEEPSSSAPGNPGNDNPVGGAGEVPNGDVSGFKPDPGTQGQGN